MSVYNIKNRNLRRAALIADFIPTALLSIPGFFASGIIMGALFSWEMVSSSIEHVQNFWDKSHDEKFNEHMAKTYGENWKAETNEFWKE